MTVQRKAKRKLSDISFEHEGAHVALVSKEQGGPANLHDYALVLKASNFSEEFVQKMQQVKVTLELPEFLRKFFNMYYEDAEILAAMMGYVQPVNTATTNDVSYEDYIQSKLQAFEILKSAYDAESLADVLATLDETEYLSMLKDQQLVEKAIKKAEKLEKSKESKTTTEVAPEVILDTAVEKSVEVGDTSPACEVKEVEVSPSVVKQELEKSMTDKTQQSEVIQKEVEVVEKSQFVAIEKALEDQRVLLEKALLS